MCDWRSRSAAASLGNLWMTCNRGVFKVSKRMLSDVAERRVNAFVSVSYGGADGIRGTEFNGNAQPAGIRAHDGTLWFPTIKGAGSVRPGQLVVNTLPPPVSKPIDPAVLAAVIDHLLTSRIAPTAA